MCLVLSPLRPTLTWVNKYEQSLATLTADDFTEAWQGQNGCGNEGSYEDCILFGV